PNSCGTHAVRSLARTVAAPRTPPGAITIPHGIGAELFAAAWTLRLKAHGTLAFPSRLRPMFGPAFRPMLGSRFMPGWHLRPGFLPAFWPDFWPRLNPFGLARRRG